MRLECSPEDVHPDRSSLFWQNGDFEKMYEALEAFANAVTWLKYLDYQCERNFPDAPNGWERFETLRKMVAERVSVPKKKDEALFEDCGSTIYDEASNFRIEESDTEEDIEELDEVDDLLAIMGWITLI